MLAPKNNSQTMTTETSMGDSALQLGDLWNDPRAHDIYIYGPNFTLHLTRERGVRWVANGGMRVTLEDVKGQIDIVAQMHLCAIRCPQMDNACTYGHSPTSDWLLSYMTFAMLASKHHKKVTNAWMKRMLDFEAPQRRYIKHVYEWANLCGSSIRPMWNTNHQDECKKEASLLVERAEMSPPGLRTALTLRAGNKIFTVNNDGAWMEDGLPVDRPVVRIAHVLENSLCYYSLSSGNNGKRPLKHDPIINGKNIRSFLHYTPKSTEEQEELFDILDCMNSSLNKVNDPSELNSRMIFLKKCVLQRLN